MITRFFFPSKFSMVNLLHFSVCLITTVKAKFDPLLQWLQHILPTTNGSEYEGRATRLNNRFSDKRY